jgi:hypothetical protein
MRYPVVDLDLPLARPFAGQKTRRPSLLERVHWLRLALLAVMLGLWPAIIFAVSRFF